MEKEEKHTSSLDIVVILIALGKRRLFSFVNETISLRGIINFFLKKINKLIYISFSDCKRVQKV